MQPSELWGRALLVVINLALFIALGSVRRDLSVQDAVRPFMGFKRMSSWPLRERGAISNPGGGDRRRSMRVDPVCRADSTDQD